MSARFTVKRPGSDFIFEGVEFDNGTLGIPKSPNGMVQSFTWCKLSEAVHLTTINWIDERTTSNKIREFFGIRGIHVKTFTLFDGILNVHLSQIWGEYSTTMKMEVPTSEDVYDNVVKALKDKIELEVGDLIKEITLLTNNTILLRTSEALLICPFDIIFDTRTKLLEKLVK